MITMRQKNNNKSEFCLFPAHGFDMLDTHVPSNKKTMDRLCVEGPLERCSRGLWWFA